MIVVNDSFYFSNESLVKDSFYSFITDQDLLFLVFQVLILCFEFISQPVSSTKS
jgi:hypothetical protein